MRTWNKRRNACTTKPQWLDITAMLDIGPQFPSFSSSSDKSARCPTLNDLKDHANLLAHTEDITGSEEMRTNKLGFRSRVRKGVI